MQSDNLIKCLECNNWVKFVVFSEKHKGGVCDDCGNKEDQIIKKRMTMQSDELKESLYPCRFCGVYPEGNPQTLLQCPDCLHYVSRPKDDPFTAKYYWNARNEKHNPFIEVKNE